MKKEIIIKLFRLWQGQMEGFGIKLVPRDFDCWISGYVAGFALGKDISVQEVKSVVDEIVESGVLKDIGVTGTAKDGIVRAIIEE